MIIKNINSILNLENKILYDYKNYKKLKVQKVIIEKENNQINYSMILKDENQNIYNYININEILIQKILLDYEILGG